VICSLAAALILPGVSGASLLAAAGGGGSAVDQYTEKTPASTGSKPVNPGKTAKTVKPTPQVARALKKVTNTKARRTIKRIATDFGFGASIDKIPAVKSPATTGHVDSSVGRSLGALITSPGSGSAGRLAVLLGVILATTVAVGISAVRKQRV
jgi:hypothetical protein